MKVYKISKDYRFAIADIVECKNGFDSLDLSPDTPELLNNFKYDWLTDESDIHPDFVYISLSLIGGSNNVSRIIKQVCHDIRLNPIKVGNNNIDVYSNIPEYSNCVNMKKSRITRFSNGDIMEISSPVLLPNDYAPLFRVMEMSSSYFCTDIFKNIVEENKLTGLLFEEIRVKSTKFLF